MSVFEHRYEMMARAELEQMQLERLQAMLVRLRRNVRRYRERLGGITVESLADLARVPLTSPEDLAEGFPYSLFAFPLREVIRVHSAVGPEGRPLAIGHTQNDLAQWGRLVARQLVASGVTANDVIQLSLGGAVYPGVSGYALGAELIEASVIAEDPLHIDYQLAMLQNYRPTILVTTRTNALELIRLMERRRVDPQSLHLRTVLLSRPVDQETREQIAAGLFASVRCNFGVGEILDPGLCVECEQGGFHVHEDHFLVEVCEGELVVTTLTREALPLLRYRTRVACELSRDRCPCGRTGVTLQPGARLDRRFYVRETPLYESQIAAALALTKAAGHPFTLEVADHRIVVSLPLTQDLFSDTILFLESLKRDIEAELLTRLGVPAELRFRNPKKP